jgi:hypothetical protein
MAVLIGIPIISKAIALRCCVGLWRGRAHALSKFVWTLILILPIGALCFTVV